MFTLKMMGGEKFTITKEEAQQFVGKSGLVPVASLGGMINISSISSILPVEVSEKANNRRQTKDGLWCIKKFGQWYLENNPDVKVNLRYYPELEDISDKKQIEVSKYAKQLTNK
jgi:hypothetical protein